MLLSLSGSGLPLIAWEKVRRVIDVGGLPKSNSQSYLQLRDSSTYDLVRRPLYGGLFYRFQVFLDSCLCVRRFQNLRLTLPQKMSKSPSLCALTNGLLGSTLRQWRMAIGLHVLHLPVASTYLVAVQPVQISRLVKLRFIVSG